MTDKHLNFKINIKLDVCTDITQMETENHIECLLRDSKLCDIGVSDMKVTNVRLCDCCGLDRLKEDKDDKDVRAI